MMTFKLNYFNTARIWFENNEILLLNINKKNFLYKFESEHSETVLNNTIILELCNPRGARVVYGVLGIKYLSKLGTTLSVKLCSTDKDLRIFQNSPISPFEQVNVGLPQAYTETILLELNKLQNNNMLQLRGELDFCYAAHGDVSSNPGIYQILTYMLINLLLIPKSQINRDILIKLYEQSQI